MRARSDNASDIAGVEVMRRQSSENAVDTTDIAGDEVIRTNSSENTADMSDIAFTEWREYCTGKMHDQHTTARISDTTSMLSHRI